jgi:hypothetical protein
MVDCRDIALEVEDLLDQPLHGDDLTSAVHVDPYRESVLHDAERDNIVRFLDRDNDQEINVDPRDNSLNDSAVHYKEVDC